MNINELAVLHREMCVCVCGHMCASLCMHNA